MFFPHLNQFPQLEEAHMQHLKAIPEELSKSILKHYSLENTEGLFLWHLLEVEKQLKIKGSQSFKNSDKHQERNIIVQCVFYQVVFT